MTLDWGVKKAFDMKFCGLDLRLRQKVYQGAKDKTEAHSSEIGHE